MNLHHVIVRLRQARKLVARGWPSVAMALAGAPTSTAQARMQEAVEARYAANPPPWVLVLTDALALMEEAREIWGTTPDAMPPMTRDLAPCGSELRMHLPDARRCAEIGLAWEDPGKLTRPQALCVLHLAVCLAECRALEQRMELRDAQARAKVERERRRSASVAARAIWHATPTSRPNPEPVKDLRSLRDLAHVASAFDQWDEDATE